MHRIMPPSPQPAVRGTDNLRIMGVTKRFGPVTAVSGASLELPAGSTLALLGPSGCGKSTLLRIVAGLEVPDLGEVRLGERSLARLPAAGRGFGMVFQDYALFPHLDVGGNIAFGLVEARIPPARRAERVAELLELVGLPGYERRRVNQLSGGQQQRVALARALAPAPDLLLLDEPLSNLDAKLRDALKSELRAILAGLRLGAIYVTHDQSEAFSLADQVALMRSGEVVQKGTVDELLDHPTDAWAARFMGHENVYSGEDASRLPAGTRGRPATTTTVSGAAILLRTELVRLARPGEGGVDATIREYVREGPAWRISFLVPAWGVAVNWRGFARDLPQAPVAGGSFGLVVPDGAWQLIGGNG